MPEHSSWFNILIPHYEELQARFRETMGVSFVNHAPVELQYVFGFAFVALLLLVLVLIVFPHFSNTEKALIPEDRLTLSTFFEAMTEGALGLMSGSMDRKTALYFLPLIGTCAFLIFFSNLIGLVPGFLPPSSNLNTTVAMSSVVFLATHIYGVKEHGIGYFAHFFGPVRKWYALPLMLLMFGIEIISHLARPLSLGIRLMGNMFADHMVVGIFLSLLVVLLPVPIMLLGVLVCIVQTLVFCLLSTIYIGMAVAHDGH